METPIDATRTTLANLSELAKRAHYWTSFSPERRGGQLIKECQNELDADILFLTTNGIDEVTVSEYASKFKRLLTSWLHAKSNCTSTMITGGSNYNVRRAEKANRSEHRHYEIFAEWRERAKKSIVRKSKPAKTYTSELERYRAELEAMKANHELMKEGNKRIKDAKKKGGNIDAYLTETFKIQPHMLDWTMKFGFGLSNNLANMKRVEDRIATLSKMETLAATTGNTEIDFNDVRIVENYEADRLQLIFPGKPEPDMITKLKRNGFKWSPRFGAWQRQLTNNAKTAVNINIFNANIFKRAA